MSECEADGMNHTSLHVPDADCEGSSCSYRPVDIRPIPKFDIVSGCTRKRKLQASELLTGSPVKRLQIGRLIVSVRFLYLMYMFDNNNNNNNIQCVYENY